MKMLTVQRMKNKSLDKSVKKRQPSKSRLILKIVITVLIAVTVVLAAVPFFRYFVIATGTQTVKTTVHEKMPDKIPAPEAIKPPTVSDVINSQSTAVNSDGSENLYSIGQIAIPEVQINQPIYVGLNSVNMVRGTVDLFPNRNPENSSLTVIGHHLLYYNWGDWLLFGGIQKLAKNDPVYLRYGNKYYEYKVDTNVIIRDTDIDKLADKGGDYLFLVTCNEGVETPYRVLVTAKKQKEVSSQQAQAAFETESHEVQKAQTNRYMIWYILPIVLAALIITGFLVIVWRM